MMLRALISAAVLALFSATLHAQEAFDAKARAAAVAPYIDDLTIGVAHVDLRRVEIKAALQHAREKIGMPGPPAEEVERLDQLLAEAKKKLPEFYVVVSLADVPRVPPFGLLRIGDGAKPEEVVRLLVELVDPGAGVPDEELQKFYFEKDGWIVFGMGRTLERLKKLKPAPSPDLARAFEVAGDTAGQAIALVTDDNRALVSGLVGALPPPFEDVNTRELMKSVRFAALGVDLPPKPQLRLGVQASDNAGADALHGLALKALDLLKEPGIIPQAKDAIPLLTPKKKDDRIYLVLKHENGDFDALAKAFEPVIASTRRAAQRLQSTKNLRQLALGLINYESGFGKFPGQAIRSKEGKPLLSWRVAILPYIEENTLYEQFKLDEPWDSEHNKKLIEKMPAIYASPSGLVKEKGRTLYVAPICKGSILASETGMKVAQVVDGTARTLMLVEANPEKAVIWTKPEDLDVNLDKPLAGLGGVWKEGILAAFCDCHTSMLKPTMKPETLRRLIQANDGEEIDFSDAE